MGKSGILNFSEIDHGLEKMKDEKISKYYWMKRFQSFFRI